MFINTTVHNILFHFHFESIKPFPIEKIKIPLVKIFNL